MLLAHTLIHTDQLTANSPDGPHTCTHTHTNIHTHTHTHMHAHTVTTRLLGLLQETKIHQSYPKRKGLIDKFTSSNFQSIYFQSINSQSSGTVHKQSGLLVSSSLALSNSGSAGSL